MANDTLNVRIGALSHGWLPIRFTVSSDDTLVVTSDIPVDPIAQLVSLARFLLSSDRGSRDFEFGLEPEYAILTSTKTDDLDSVNVRLVQPGCNLSARVARIPTATQIWRAIRGIESVTLAAIDEKQWNWEFPTAQMDMLASEIETAKYAQ